MIIKSEAICIKKNRYGESSVICKMFTLNTGLSSLLIQGLNRKSSQIKPSHIEPGNLLEIVIYQKPNAGIQRVKDLKIINPLINIHLEIKKSAVLQFMLEIISKTNENDLKDEMVYNFLKESILDLENYTKLLSIFPLKFLIGYLRFSGWFPNLEDWQTNYIFNLDEGNFGIPKNDTANNVLSPEHSNELYKILLGVQNHKTLDKTVKFRKELFNIILKYYEIHILKGKKIKSPMILSEILA